MDAAASDLDVGGRRLRVLDFVDHYIYLPNGTCVSIRERYPNLFPADPISED